MWNIYKSNAGDSGLIPGSRRFPGEGNGNPLQYACLGNPIDRGAWWAIVHRVTRVRHNLVTKPPLQKKNRNKNHPYFHNLEVYFTCGIKYMCGHTCIHIYIANIWGNLEWINLKKRNSISGTLRAELFWERQRQPLRVRSQPGTHSSATRCGDGVWTLNISTFPGHLQQPRPPCD